MTNVSCRCGHSPELHASNRFACIMRYDSWPDRHMHRQRGPRSCECSLYREARWFDLHSWWRHAAVRLWWSLPTKHRWWIVDHWPIKGRCTCDLCDSVLKAEPEWRADYLGQWTCLCDFPLPIDAGVPMRGRCYCAPLDGGAP